MARWTREREAIPFKLSSPFTPSGDQPQAIAKLDAQLRARVRRPDRGRRRGGSANRRAAGELSAA